MPTTRIIVFGTAELSTGSGACVVEIIEEPTARSMDRTYQDIISAEEAELRGIRDALASVPSAPVSSVNIESTQSNVVGYIDGSNTTESHPVLRGEIRTEVGRITASGSSTVTASGVSSAKIDSDFLKRIRDCYKQ